MDKFAALQPGQGFDGFAGFLLGKPQVIEVLKIEPKLRAGAEEVSEAESRVAGHRACCPAISTMVLATTGLGRECVRDQEHGERAEFALHGVEHHAQGFERDSAEQGAVLLFTKNDRSSALTAIQPKQYIADLASDFGAIRESEGALRVRADTEFAEQGRRNDGIDGTGVHQETELDRVLRLCGVGNVQLDVSQSHKRPCDSSVSCGKKCVKLNVGLRHATRFPGRGRLE